MIKAKYNVNLEDVDVYKDKENNCYLSLKYKVKNPDGSIAQYTFPSVRLPISEHSFDISTCADTDAGIYTSTTINCGFGDLPLTKGQVKTQKGATLKNVCFLKEIIKEATPKEMTLDEIEKQLGHKVKIVNRKGDDYDAI